MNSSEAKRHGAAAKALALSDFQKRFPHANMSRFQVQVEFDVTREALGRVLFPDGDGSWENPLIEHQKYWSSPLKAALGVQQDGGFPAQLSPIPLSKPRPVPAIDFSATTGQIVADLFNKEMKIYVSPTDYFTTKFRKIFKAPKIKVTSSKYARPWIKGPNMGFWQQQLNFAVWCATTGCGVSREMLFDTSLQLSEQLRTFYQFHVTTQHARSCTRWVGFRARTRCLTPQSSARSATRMILPRTSSFVQSSTLTQALISATPAGRTEASARCTLGLPVSVI